MSGKLMLELGLCVGLATTVWGAEEDGPRVARYRNDARAAFSYTFDDGFRSQVEDVLSVIDPLGIRGTFFVMPLAIAKMPGNFVTWESLKAMQTKGHEVGTHAQINPKLQEVDDAAVSGIVNGGWELIRDKTGKAPVAFAYPGGSKHDDSRVQAIVAQHHPFVREKVDGYGSAGKRQWTPEAARDRVRKAMEQGDWIVAMVHSIVNGYSPFKSIDEFRGHCEWLAQQGEALWIAPMGEVSRYVRERDAAQVKVLKSAGNALQFEVVCDLEPKDVYNTPLTVVIPAAKVTGATATVFADGAALPVVLRDGLLLVDVPPHAGPVSVEMTPR